MLSFNNLGVLRAKIKIKNFRNRAGIGPKPMISLGKWQSGPSPGTPRAKDKIKNHFKHSQDKGLLRPLNRTNEWSIGCRRSHSRERPPAADRPCDPRRLRAATVTLDLAARNLPPFTIIGNRNPNFYLGFWPVSGRTWPRDPFQRGGLEK